MTVQTQIPASYTRIGRRHKDIYSTLPKYVNWPKSIFDTIPYILQTGHIPKAGRVSVNYQSADNYFMIHQLKATLFKNIRDGYMNYALSPKSVLPKITPSMPSVLRKRIQEIERLEAGWDSYSASPISNKAIKASISLLTQISHKLGSRFVEDVFIAPCADGSIQLEWELNSKELILKMVSNGKQDLYLFVSSSGEEREGTITSQEEIVNMLQETLQP